MRKAIVLFLLLNFYGCELIIIDPSKPEAGKQTKPQTTTGSSVGTDTKPASGTTDTTTTNSNISSELSYYVGSWDIFIPGAVNTVESGGSVYNEYSFGATAPGLVIRADGTYTWKGFDSKPAKTGTWKADDEFSPSDYLPGATDYMKKYKPILVTDSRGTVWRMWRDDSDPGKNRAIMRDVGWFNNYWATKVK